MGADMVLGMIAHRSTLIPKIEPALVYISTLKLEDFIEAPDALDYLAGDVVEIFDADGNLTPAGLEVVKTTLGELIGEVFDSLGSRDVTSFIICGWNCYFSGGMSWGDTEDSNALWQRLISDWGVIGEKIYLAADFDWPPMVAEAWAP